MQTQLHAPTNTEGPEGSASPRGWLASRLYQWLDARRWYWSLGEPVVPALRDWPVSPAPRRGPRR